MVTAAVSLTVFPKCSRFRFHLAEKFIDVTQNKLVFSERKKCFKAQIYTDKGIDLKNLGHGSFALGGEDLCDQAVKLCIFGVVNIESAEQNGVVLTCF